MDRMQRKCLDRITESLGDGEQVLSFVATASDTGGHVFGHTGVLAATTSRLIFCARRAYSRRIDLFEEYSYRAVNAIAFATVGTGVVAGNYGTNNTSGQIALSTASAQRTFMPMGVTTPSNGAESKLLVDVALQRIAEQRAKAPVASTESNSPGDPSELLRQLASLKDAGILTNEEFSRKKAQVLDRL